MNKSLRSISMACAGWGLFSLVDTTVKFLTDQYHVLQITFLTGFVSLIFMIVFGAYFSGPKAFKSDYYHLHALRGLFLTFVGLLNLFALSRLQLDQFYILIFTFPFWIVLLGTIFFKNEKVNPQRVAAIIVSFLALLYMLRPGSDLFNLEAVAVLVSAFLAACGFLITRFMSPDESTPLFSITVSIPMVIITAPFLTGRFVIPTLNDSLLFIFVGIIAALGMLLLSVAFHRAPASSTVAPFHYTQMIWGVVLGYLVFGDIPNMDVIIGGTILILTGIYIIRHEIRSG